MGKTKLIQDYWKLSNTYTNLMPFLISEGLTPLTSKEIMEYRIKAYEDKEESEIDFWLKQGWDTTDGIALRHNELLPKNSWGYEEDKNWFPPAFVKIKKLKTLDEGTQLK
jgi:catalase